ncbi:hypothetical protein GOODEAATRI_004354 [Goodea atripinnis]|uniref:Uncharacterized protein n=1 Tax=Goodea atripinnis TaxID=208336 RepID=A0ABV0MP74_9TELE
MTRRSCAIYATGIVCAHLLIVGIALVVAQVFQTMIHSRLKKRGAGLSETPALRRNKRHFHVASLQHVGEFCDHTVRFLARLAEVRLLAAFCLESLMLFQRWQTLPSVWVFDVLAWHRVLAKLEVPCALGWPRENVTFLENGTKVYALNPKSFVFVPEKAMSWWSSNQSNMINGTDGAVFHPLINRNELLYIFAADLCRSIHLAYVEDVEVKGIQAYRFAPPNDVLMNPKENPTNAGFCVPAGECLGTGVLKVSVCREGAPIVVSFPHFYQADPAYINAVDGLNPNKEEHETYLDLQPTATVDDNSASQMRMLLLIVTLVSNFPLLIVGMGIILLLVLVVLFFRNRQKKTAKDDTAYTQVSDKLDDSSEKPASQPMKNGSYIAMSPVEAQKC